jgi:hypothetical protein
MIIFGLLMVVSFVVLNFNSFEFPMQMGVSIVFLVACYLFGALKRDKVPLLAYSLFGIASLFLLFIGIYLLNRHEMNNPALIVMYVVFCSLVWIMSGMMARMAIFQFCGWVGLVFAYSWLLHRQLDETDWGTVQLSWVPLSLLFAWIGWLVLQKSKQSGIVFLLLSSIVWFMPEFYGIMYLERLSQELIQFSLMGKIAVEGILLFAFRKKWIEWVT